MQIKPGNFCPLIKKDCVGIQCSWFTQIRGTNPNTGAEIDEWNCAITWFPILMVENSQQQRQTSAAIESFRNEMVKANENGQKILLETINQTPKITNEKWHK
jgi:hypothetical protein